MIAKQTLFFNEDRTKLVPESDPAARFLFVREGNEIDDALVEKHNAADLVNKAAKTSAKTEAAAPPTPPAGPTPTPTPKKAPTPRKARK